MRGSVPKEDNGPVLNRHLPMNAGRNGCQNYPAKRLREFRSRKNALDLIRRRYSVGDFAIRPPSAVSGPFMHPPNLLFALVLVAALGVKAASAQPALGAQGAEGEPHRLQQWLVPSPDPATAAHAVLFRPPGEGPFPLAVIAHASTQNVLRRAQMPQPEYRALAGLAGGARFCRAGPRASGPWRDGRKIPRRSGRLRRGRLRQIRPRHGG